MTIRHQKNGKQHILYCEDSQSYSAQTYFNESLFQPDALKTNHLIYRTARGRGCSYFFRYRQQQWVLRHYWRGGWMRNINRDAYCWQSLRNTRAYQELALLQKIQHWQLPAPTAIAARICYGMGFYRADIITGVIPNSQTLVEMLGKTLPSPPWQAIGQTIRRFHQYGIYHDDLNAHNILISKDNVVFLIDFDKGRVVSSQQRSCWMKKNLSRLLRSLYKEKNKCPHLSFTEENWNELIGGYEKMSP